MGNQGTPRRAEPQFTIGAAVTFVTDPALMGREGMILAIDPQYEHSYTVQLDTGDIITCRADDLAPVP